jgi:hypothetical protein
MRRALAALLLAAAAATPALADPPDVQHQPNACSVPDKPISLCATITDDGQVAKSRIYFRIEGQKYWYAVEMNFGGIDFCGTLPAPRAGKVKTIEYYIQSTDDNYESQRTSTYKLSIQTEDQCAFPPVEKDAARASSIVVVATSSKQGKKLDDEFAATGVSFVPSLAK